MTQEQEQVDRQRDHDVAVAAIEDYFTGQLGKCRADLERVALLVADAERRREEVRGGSRLTSQEALLVHVAQLPEETGLTMEQREARLSRAQAVKRGLAAEGYPI